MDNYNGLLLQVAVTPRSAWPDWKAQHICRFPDGRYCEAQ